MQPTSDYSWTFLPVMRNAQDFMNHEMSATFSGWQSKMENSLFGVFSWRKSNRCAWIAITVMMRANERCNIGNFTDSKIQVDSSILYRNSQTLTIICLTRISEILDRVHDIFATLRAMHLNEDYMGKCRSWNIIAKILATWNNSWNKLRNNRFLFLNSFSW